MLSNQIKFIRHKCSTQYNNSVNSWIHIAFGWTDRRWHRIYVCPWKL